MTAAYRLRGIGWMAVLVGVILGFYLVSLRVAAERKRLDAVNAQIDGAHRDIRALETEFDTRANLAQLEKWNGDTLALAAPTAQQFARDDAALAALDPAQAGEPVKAAVLVVPTGLPAAPVPAPAPVAVHIATPVAPVPAPSAAPVARMMTAALTSAPTHLVEPAHAKPQRVALLDRHLLSDSTFGDLASGARAEARRR